MEARIVSLRTHCLCHLRNQLIAAIRQHGLTVRIALFSAAIVLAGFAVWHLVRTPFLVHRSADVEGEIPHWGFGVVGVFVLLAIIGGGYEFFNTYLAGDAITSHCSG